MQQNSSLVDRKKKWYKRWWAILLFVVLYVAAILIAAFGFWVFDLSKTINSQNNNNALTATTTKYNAEGINNYWIGTSSPKVTIVEFADFNCPHCLNSFSTIRSIGLRYKDSVKIIFRDYPEIAETSLDLALAARCAGAQSLFWQMHDKLFLNQGKLDPSDKEQIASLAQSTGVDLKKFLICMDEQTYLPDIKKDVSDAESLGVTGTPTWFINGYKISGEIPKDTFEKLIDNLLK